MRWVTYRSEDAKTDRVGLLMNDGIHALTAGVELVNLLGERGSRMRAAADWATNQPAEIVPLEKATLGAPIGRPPSIRDFSSFEQHVRTARERRGGTMDPGW